MDQLERRVLNLEIASGTTETAIEHQKAIEKVVEGMLTGEGERAVSPKEYSLLRVFNPELYNRLWQHSVDLMWERL